MDQKSIETILKFFMAKLPENELAELDALLEKGTADNPAMDAVFGTGDRRQWLGHTPVIRNAVRRSKRDRVAMDAKSESVRRTATAEMFPHNDRLHTGLGR